MDSLAQRSLRLCRGNQLLGGNVIEIILIVLIVLLLLGSLGNLAAFIWTLLIGALIGWIASIVMRTNYQQGALMNILVGIVGSLLGRWLFAGVLGIGGAAAAGALSIMGILWGVLGAIVLIAILKAVHVLK